MLQITIHSSKLTLLQPDYKMKRKVELGEFQSREVEISDPDHVTHHSHSMYGEDVPRCVACDCDLTVEHIMIECGDFAEVRQRSDAENSGQLFREISITDVFDFCRK